MNNEILMTPEEKVIAVKNLRNKIEIDFVSLGQLLSELKRTQVHKRKGFKNFKEFVETEFNFANSFASKLISIYYVFVTKNDLSELEMQEIGLDRLNIVKPIVKDSDKEIVADWLEKAKECTVIELREEVSILREKEKKKNKTMKDVFIEQYQEKMLSFFNCNKKELEFKLSLYFQDMSLEVVQEMVKIAKQKYELHIEEELEHDI